MKNKQLTAIMTGICLGMVSLVATAGGPSYTYGEIGYRHFDADKYDGNAGHVNISFGATEMIFLKMGYARMSIDGPTISGIDTDRFNIGIGGHMSVSDDIDALAVVSYLDQEYSGGIPTEADEGYQVDVGLRGMMNKKVELNATASFRHMNYTSALGVSDDEDIGFEVGTVIKLKKKFHFTGSASYFDETEEAGVLLGIRLYL